MNPDTGGEPYLHQHVTRGTGYHVTHEVTCQYKYGRLPTRTKCFSHRSYSIRTREMCDPPIGIQLLLVHNSPANSTNKHFLKEPKSN